MNEPKKLPDRKRPAQFPTVSVGNRSTMLFVTVCAKDRRKVLANERMHRLLREAWMRADAYRVGRYVIMPDHVHFFCVPGRVEAPALADWVRYWKTRVARQWGGEGSLWQRAHWDTQLRKGASFSAKWIYVNENPVRAGLVKSANEWAYQGEVWPLIWSD